jgi:hypothetical protein
MHKLLDKSIGKQIATPRTHICNNNGRENNSNRALAVADRSGLPTFLAAIPNQKSRQTELIWRTF